MPTTHVALHEHIFIFSTQVILPLLVASQPLLVSVSFLKKKQSAGLWEARVIVILEK
jgi:hypothetical protein